MALLDFARLDLHIIYAYPRGLSKWKRNAGRL